MKLKPLLFILLLLISFSVLAQPGDPGGDPDVPITGLEFLIGGGLLLGIRNLLSKRKTK